MINIEICPAVYGHGGYYSATGHAAKGQEAVCTATTAIEECLAANLQNTWHIRLRRDAAKGSYILRWNKSDKKGMGLRRANDAAGFAYTGLRALAAAYPEQLTVVWKRPEIERSEKT